MATITKKNKIPKKNKVPKILELYLKFPCAMYKMCSIDTKSRLHTGKHSQKMATF